MHQKDFSGITIEELIRADSLKAYTLHYLGIAFYEYGGLTLKQACAAAGVQLDYALRELDLPADDLHPDDFLLISSAPEAIIGCLRRAHQIFINQRLPYIEKLIQNFKCTDTRYDAMIKDLRILFPLFMQDFARHIQMEESRLFNYILSLCLGTKGKTNLAELFFIMDKESVHHFVIEHDAHDDEMTGIRNITDGYRTDLDTPLHLNVLFAELLNLEKDLKKHASIENEILFPKAVTLESRVQRILRECAKLN